MASVVFYIFAHQDDWQLFRGHQAKVDVEVGAKVVFICVTAGDGGLGDVDLCVQRERGMINSCRFAADNKLDDTVYDPFLVNVNGHTLARYQYKNTVLYFLRIRDGGNSPGTGALEQLRTNGVETPMTGVATPYQSWDDLLATMKAIMEQERGPEPSPWVNAQDPNANADLNPEQVAGYRDNPDHIQVGLAVSQLSQTLADYNYVYFRGYPIGLEEPVLTEAQAQTKRDLFKAYLSGGPRLVTDYNDAHDIYESWFSRSHPK